jgi:predicted ATP-dependent serine protease
MEEFNRVLGGGGAGSLVLIGGGRYWENTLLLQMSAGLAAIGPVPHLQ